MFSRDTFIPVGTIAELIGVNPQGVESTTARVASPSPPLIWYWTATQPAGTTVNQNGSTGCVAAANGGFWICNSGQLAATVFQTSWFVSATGNDSLDGTTAANAITEAERQRRWGPIVRLASPTTINYLNSPATPVNLNAQLALAASLSLLGTRTQTKNGAFTAVTTLNRGTQTPWSVTGGTLGAADVGSIIRITSGARIGANARVMKDLGGNQVRTTPFGTGSVSSFWTTVTPVNTDPFEVVTLPTLTLGAIQVAGLSNTPPVASPLQNTLLFDSLTIDGGANILGVVAALNIETFYTQCILKRFGMYGLFHIPLGGGMDLISTFGGSTVNALAFGCLNSQISVDPSCVVVFDLDCLFQNSQLSVIAGAACDGGLVSFFDTTGADLALVVNAGATYRSVPTFSTDLTWGTANTGHGAAVKSAGHVLYTTKPSVNAGLGAGREAVVGGTDKLWGAGIPFNDSGAAASAAAIVALA